MSVVPAEASLVSRGSLDSSVRLHLAAVQAALAESYYRDVEVFAAWVQRLAQDAADRAHPTADALLIAFPEAIALPLLFTVENPAAATGSASLLQAAWRSARGSWGLLVRAAWRYRAPGPAAAFLARAPAVHDAYVAAFRAAARRTGATVVGGSAFLPGIEVQAARGTHVTDARVHNVAYTFAPSGALLGTSRKVHLTPGLESRVGLRRGTVEALPVMEAPFGRLAVAVCLDGWHEGVVARLDAEGAEVIVQPSANDASWTRRWPPDPRLTEGEAWLQRGLRARLQGRVNLRYGVNPMLVGSAFGFAPQGRSAILADASRTTRDWAEGRSGVVAIAQSATEEAVVGATVELPGAGAGSPAGAGA